MHKTTITGATGIWIGSTNVPIFPPLTQSHGIIGGKYIDYLITYI